MLAAMYPGRVDLGLGRAAGTDGRTAYALQRDRREAAPDDFFDHLQELLAYLDRTLPAEHPFARLADRIAGRPDPFLLGSSPQSAVWAAQLGLPYVFADFINLAGREDRGPLPGELRRAGRGRTRSSPRGCCAPTPTRRPSGWRCTPPHADRPAPPRAADPGADASRRRRRTSASQAAARVPDGRPAGHHRDAGDGPPGRRAAGGGVRGRRGDGRRHHARPRRAAAVVRAPGRGVRPRRRPAAETAAVWTASGTLGVAGETSSAVVVRGTARHARPDVAAPARDA